MAHSRAWQPRHGHCHARDGRVKRLRATYKRTGGVRHFLAFYDMETDRLYGRFTRCKTWVEFLAFLKWVRRRYPSSQVRTWSWTTMVRI